MSKRKRAVLVCTALCAALLIFSITILPAIVKSRAVQALQGATGRTTRLESVSINPLTLTLTARGFAMNEKGGAPFISIGAIRASVSPASIYRRALVLSQVQIDSPAITLTRTGPNRYNFSDIQERLQAGKKTEKKGESRFSINNITLTGGSVDFNDQAVAGGRVHRVRNLKIGIPFISNIPYLVEQYTAPRISAVVNGAPFSFAGRMKPLSTSMESSVHIGLKRLDLPQFVAYSPRKLPAELKSGTLTIDTDVKYRVFSHRNPELIISGLVRLNDMAIAMKNGQPLVRVPLLEVQASRLELFARLFWFSAIRADGLELFVSRDKSRKWIFERLAVAEKRGEERKAAASQPAAGGKPQHPSIQISSLSLANASVHFSDALATGGFRGSLSRINLRMKNLDTAFERYADYELSLLADQEATLNSRGSISFTPLSLKNSIALKGLKLQRGWPYLAQHLTAPVRGTMDLSADLTYSGEKGVTLEKGSLALRQLSTRYGRGDGLDLGLFSINGASYRQKENSLSMDEVRLSKGSISVSRESDGALSLLSLFRSGEQSAPPSQRAKTVSRKPGAASRPLSYRLKRFQTERLNLAFTDKSREEKPRFILRNTGISLTNLNGPKFTPAHLNCSTIFGTHSPIRLRGEITPLPFRFRGNISVGRLPITDFEDYFPDNLNLSVIDGYLDSSLGLDISLREGKPYGTFRGSAGVRSFHSVDADAEEDLLKWESLQLDQFQGKLEPFSLSIRQIALNGVYSRIIVRKNGTLNLQNLVEHPAPATTTGQKGVPPPATVARQAPATKRQISIGAVTIQEGTVAFSDHHLPQQFTSTFYNLGGRISGMSSDDSRFADVDLRGNLESHSPLQITGTINPLRDDLFVDLKIAFKDIELSPVTPYSGTYLGYSVERGKLFLDLKYHIEQKELRSENRIFIDQFTFGNRVESQKATRLPVRLGLALLKDRKGEIHLDVPVTGRTDDPQFSIWRLVFQVLQNLLVKAATSPFSLLSSLFGEGTDLSSIQFSQGSSALPAGEAQKLSALAKALSDRPALKMEVKGYVDREKDTEGYRRELFNRKLLNEKTLSLAKQRRGEGADPAHDATLQPEEYSRYLEAVYRREKFPKPRNAFGLVKELPDGEMKKLIIANTVVSEQDLHSLAQERSAAVMAHLVKGGVAAERIFLKKDDIHRLPEKSGQIRSRVELNAIAP